MLKKYGDASGTTLTGQTSSSSGGRNQQTNADQQYSILKLQKKHKADHKKDQPLLLHIN